MSGEVDGSEAPEAAVAAPEPAVQSAGARLREERQRQGLAVADIAQRLKYAPRQVEALETDDHAALPGLTFERGFVRGYAKLLGIDAAPLVAQLERQAEERGGPTTVQLQSISASQTQFPARSGTHASAWPWLLAILIVVAGVGGYSIYHWSPPESLTRSDAPPPRPPAGEGGQEPRAASGALEAPGGGGIVGVPGAGATAGTMDAAHDASAFPPATGAVLPPAPTVPAGPPADASPTGTARDGVAPAVGSAEPKIRLVFSGESWTEVRDAGGKVVYSRKSAPGTEQTVEGQPPFDLVVGNARDVKVFYRGAEVDLAPYIKVSVARLQLK